MEQVILSALHNASRSHDRTHNDLASHFPSLLHFIITKTEYAQKNKTELWELTSRMLAYFFLENESEDFIDTLLSLFPIHPDTKTVNGIWQTALDNADKISMSLLHTFIQRCYGRSKDNLPLVAVIVQFADLKKIPFHKVFGRDHEVLRKVASNAQTIASSVGCASTERQKIHEFIKLALFVELQVIPKKHKQCVLFLKNDTHLAFTFEFNPYNSSFLLYNDERQQEPLVCGYRLDKTFVAFFATLIPTEKAQLSKQKEFFNLCSDLTYVPKRIGGFTHAGAAHLIVQKYEHKPIAGQGRALSLAGKIIVALDLLDCVIRLHKKGIYHGNITSRSVVVNVGVQKDLPMTLLTEFDFVQNFAQFDAPPTLYNNKLYTIPDALSHSLTKEDVSLFDEWAAACVLYSIFFDKEPEWFAAFTEKSQAKIMQAIKAISLIRRKHLREVREKTALHNAKEVVLQMLLPTKNGRMKAVDAYDRLLKIDEEASS